MEAKKVTSLVNRIKKANNSFSVMGAMMLSMEFDSMDLSDLATVATAAKTKGISSNELNGAIARKAGAK